MQIWPKREFPELIPPASLRAHASSTNRTQQEPDSSSPIVAKRNLMSLFKDMKIHITLGLFILKKEE
jgi:hypothetical protein